MKKRVVLSRFSWFVTLATVVIVAALMVAAARLEHNHLSLIILGAVAAVLVLSGLFYMPLSVSVDKEGVHVRRPLKVKTIPLNEIAEVKLCQPTMGAIRMCGSGGWLGWYGWFREGDIGQYFAYYGKSSDCFLLTLRDGRKYMLGCDDPSAMVEAIRSYT